MVLILKSVGSVVSLLILARWFYLVGFRRAWWGTIANSIKTQSIKTDVRSIRRLARKVGKHARLLTDDLIKVALNTSGNYELVYLAPICRDEVAKWYDDAGGSSTNDDSYGWSIIEVPIRPARLIIETNIRAIASLRCAAGPLSHLIHEENISETVDLLNDGHSPAALIVPPRHRTETAYSTGNSVQGNGIERAEVFLTDVPVLLHIVRAPQNLESASVAVCIRSS